MSFMSFTGNSIVNRYKMLASVQWRNTGDQSRLDAMGFAPFGKVVEGMSVIDKLYAGYGETSGGGMRAGHQGKLFEEGNAYLDRDFHLLDRLGRAEIIEERE